jgi:ribosomal protein L29
MLKKTCIDCKEEFEVEDAKHWATRCLPCWQIHNDRQGKQRVETLHMHVEYWRNRAQGCENYSAIEELEKTLKELEAENRQLRFETIVGDSAKVRDLEQQVADLQSEVARWRIQAMMAEVYSRKAAPPEGFKGQIKRLLQLCHPDKHGGSEAATNATQWLLKMRESL